MSKEKYDPPDPRRIYTIMSSEDAANGKKSHWAELEITGRVRFLSSSLWTLHHLTALHLSDNSLSHIPPDISKLHNLVYLDLSSNKIRNLPAELGNVVSLRELLLNNNLLRALPYELGKLFQLQTLGLKGNPLAQELLGLYQEPDGTRRLLNYLLDNLSGTAKISTEHPPPRSWIMLQEPDRTRPTVNVLQKKYIVPEEPLTEYPKRPSTPPCVWPGEALLDYLIWKGPVQCFNHWTGGNSHSVFLRVQPS